MRTLTNSMFNTQPQEPCINLPNLKSWEKRVRQGVYILGIQSCKRPNRKQPSQA